MSTSSLRARSAVASSIESLKTCDYLFVLLVFNDEGPHGVEQLAPLRIWCRLRQCIRCAELHHGFEHVSYEVVG